MLAFFLVFRAFLTLTDSNRYVIMIAWING